MTHPDDATLQTWFDGELPDAERVALDLHLTSCARCVGAANALRSLRATVDHWAAAQPDADAAFADAVFAKLNVDAAKPVVTEQAPVAAVIPLNAARGAAPRRAFPIRRVAFPAIAVAAAAFLALRFSPSVSDPTRPPEHPTAHVAGPVEADPAQPIEVGAGDGPGGAEVTRVDVQGAKSYAVLQIPGVAPGALTAVVWIQDPVDGEASPTTTQ
jgi:hypothetical protein